MRVKALITIAALALGAAITGTGTAAAATTDPFCDASDTVNAGNGWKTEVPTATGRTATTSPSCYLKQGDRSLGVRILQRTLKGCYNASVPDSGVYDSTTRAAVQRVQRLHGLTTDGVYGPRTMKALNWRLFKEVGGTTVRSERCYRPFASRTIAPAPAQGSYSPSCVRWSLRYAGNRWWAGLPGTPTRSGGVHFACYLKPGDRGSGVLALQRALRYCYHSKIVGDGVYGPKTQAVVRSVQRLHGVKADGVYGPQTMKAMYWRLEILNPAQDSERCYSPF